MSDWKMTLEEAFKKYSNEINLKRPSHLFYYDILWLKQLKAWGNEESRDMGYIIPQHMIDDANADDWEIVE